MVDKRTTQKLEERLKQELATLEIGLTDIGKMDPSNPADWHGTNGDIETGTADASILADRFEAKTTNEGIVTELEERFNNIKDALIRIKKGTYGICSNGGGKIPLARLEANPAADTCIEHAD
ncbi:MAG: TraR/DksA C4-type zinc finger protein [Candidatus Pacebacteria bacterium]|nr:TraR/DksA C4-type zinc finger protein [Candidatus Paceibacterota bacterium]